ncbi:MAG: phosphatidate cytidylyltransferase [Roseomonas sp.]|nr:phosphatidate cytidylyltransferase [Roseomonas sp.]MCA3429335.1 phosphatidate cytidylyltransferase [Roseomonas sp.]MCA3431810.1 phosphatidate cytidylyltransferase [Roseomonas sp.]
MGCAPDVTEATTSKPEGSAPRPWRDLGLRGASAAVLIPIAVFGIWSGGVVWDVLVGVAVVLLSWEWARFCKISIWRWPGLLMPAISLVVMLLAAFGPPLAALGLLAAGTLVLFLLQRQGDIWPAAGLFYIGLVGFSLVLLRGEDHAGLLNTLFLVLIVWASDTGAYMAGRALGGPKLAPAISPGKTWSGAAGGLIAATLIGTGAAALLAPGGASRAAAIAAMLGVMSQAGDLLESAIKRRFGVKDSSSLIPGHGGMLDRLDGVMAAAPMATALALLAGRGMPLWH